MDLVIAFIAFLLWLPILALLGAVLHYLGRIVAAALRFYLTPYLKRAKLERNV